MNKSITTIQSLCPWSHPRRCDGLLISVAELPSCFGIHSTHQKLSKVRRKLSLWPSKWSGCAYSLSVFGWCCPRSLWHCDIDIIEVLGSLLKGLVPKSCFRDVCLQMYMERKLKGYWHELLYQKVYLLNLECNILRMQKVVCYVLEKTQFLPTI